MCGSKLALENKVLTNYYYCVCKYLPCCKNLATIGAGVAVILNAFVNYFDVSVQMSFFTENFIALRAGCWLVNLNVEVNLLDVTVESTFLAEYVGAVRADDSVNIVEPPHVRGQVSTLLGGQQFSPVLQKTTGCPTYHVPLGFLHFSCLKMHP